MSILGSIVSAIFNHANASAAPATQSTQTIPAPEAPTAPVNAAPASDASQAPVDIDAVLTQLATQHHEKLDWKHSIVDLLKALDLDSSRAARKALATELHYAGDEHDTATMNMWLHREVIAELVKNGGKVPADLQH
jgi:Domain of unknown function (DUF3597)